MSKRIIMVGETYSRLLVFEEKGKKAKAICSCGVVKTYLRANLLAGYTKSCGCFRNEQVQAANQTHGQRTIMSGAYRSWRAMKARCDNPMKDSSERYSERGIVYDPDWSEFENFYRDMGDRPEGLELDRIDNNGNYTKENCRWTTHQENCQNRGY